jgi:hypothetical protein
VADVAQRLDLTFDYRPSHDPEADVYVLPWVRVDCPKVGKVILAMARRDVVSLPGAPDAVVSQPLEFAAPKGYHARWYATGTEEILYMVRAIRECLDHWGMAFLDEFTRIDSFISAYERCDYRWPKTVQDFIRIVAAYVLVEKPHRASRVLEERFGKPGPRRKYAKLFEYVDSFDYSRADGAIIVRLGRAHPEIAGALLRLLGRRTEDAFVSVEYAANRKLVQFGRGPTLRIDVPCAPLGEDEAQRAGAAFRRRGVLGPTEYDAPDWSTGDIRHGGSYQLDFGTDEAAAAQCAIDMLKEVYGLTDDAEVEIVEN